MAGWRQNEYAHESTSNRMGKRGQDTGSVVFGPGTYYASVPSCETACATTPVIATARARQGTAHRDAGTVELVGACCALDVAGVITLYTKSS